MSKIKSTTIVGGQDVQTVAMLEWARPQWSRYILALVCAVAIGMSSSVSSASTHPDEPDAYDDTKDDSVCSMDPDWMEWLCLIGYGIFYAGKWVVEEGHPDFEKNIFRPVRDKVVEETKRLADQWEREIKRLEDQLAREGGRVMDQFGNELERGGERVGREGERVVNQVDAEVDRIGDKLGLW